MPDEWPLAAFVVVVLLVVLAISAYRWMWLRRGGGDCS